METHSLDEETFCIDLAKFNIFLLIVYGFIFFVNGFIVYIFFSFFYDDFIKKTISMWFIIPLIIILIGFIIIVIVGIVILKLVRNPIQSIIIEGKTIRLITKNKRSEYYIQPEYIKSIQITYSSGPRYSTTSFTFFIDNSVFNNSYIKESFSFTNYHLGDVANGNRTTQLIQFLTRQYPEIVTLNNITWIR
ncbi:MAG: hypothetical protein N3F66_03160 [Spirochaetes bacterium]|nr:hypothetical protein [Spirochaetota bacterium]